MYIFGAHLEKQTASWKLTAKKKTELCHHLYFIIFRSTYFRSFILLSLSFVLLVKSFFFLSRNFTSSCKNTIELWIIPCAWNESMIKSMSQKKKKKIWFCFKCRSNLHLIRAIIHANKWMAILYELYCISVHFIWTDTYAVPMANRIFARITNLGEPKWISMYVLWLQQHAHTHICDKRDGKQHFGGLLLVSEKTVWLAKKPLDKKHMHRSLKVKLFYTNEIQCRWFYDIITFFFRFCFNVYRCRINKLQWS